VAPSFGGFQTLSQAAAAATGRRRACNSQQRPVAAMCAGCSATRTSRMTIEALELRCSGCNTLTSRRRLARGRALAIGQSCRLACVELRARRGSRYVEPAASCRRREQIDAHSHKLTLIVRTGGSSSRPAQRPESPLGGEFVTNRRVSRARAGAPVGGRPSLIDSTATGERAPTVLGGRDEKWLSSGWQVD
jgi:hypothetical protein